MEKFRPIPGLEHYLISKTGQIYNTKTQLFRQPYKHKSRSSQYLRVYLYNKGRTYRFFVHELVLLAHAGPKPAGYECNHLDLDTMNNHINNLEYCTPRQNKEHYKKRRNAKRKGVLNV